MFTKPQLLIGKNLIIGTDNFIGPYVVIGGNAQHPEKEVMEKYTLVIIMFLMNMLIYIDLLIKKKQL